MISEMAIEDIEQLEAEGLKPTARDIIKLNALAIKYEAEKGRCAGLDKYLLPRVAYLSDKVYFREPCIGHEIWIDKVLRFCSDDIDTIIAIKAYALSHDVRDLPDGDSPSAVIQAMEDFKKTMSSYHKQQIYLALRYVIYGNDWTKNENAVDDEEDKEDEDKDFEDWETCIGIGLLNDGIALQLGLTLSELKGLTRRHFESIRESVFKLHHIEKKSKSK